MTGVLILGGGGMIGHLLARRIAAEGVDGRDPRRLTLVDLSFPDEEVAGATRVTAQLTDPGVPERLAADRPDVIFHLAAVVSGEAEADFEKGWQVNMMTMWRLLEALRREHLASGGSYCPRLVFTSSVAVFGGPYPERIDDIFLTAPQTSYGAQKACCELMLSDFSRKGFVDGLSLRLPTISVRPGTPNKAASGFFSGIIREPLNGQRAVLPVSTDVRHWHASPRAAVGFLLHAATLDTARLEGRRALNLPGVSCTVADQIEALRRVGGDAAVDLIDHRPDPQIMSIVAGWPRDFDAARARTLGFEAETTFDEILSVYVEDHLGRS